MCDKADRQEQSGNLGILDFHGKYVTGIYPGFIVRRVTTSWDIRQIKTGTCRAVGNKRIGMVYALLLARIGILMKGREL